MARHDGPDHLQTPGYIFDVVENSFSDQKIEIRRIWCRSLDRPERGERSCNLAGWFPPSPEQAHSRQCQLRQFHLQNPVRTSTFQLGPRWIRESDSDSPPVVKVYFRICLCPTPGWSVVLPLCESRSQISLGDVLSPTYRIEIRYLPVHRAHDRTASRWEADAHLPRSVSSETYHMLAQENCVYL
jgi:hypothetical protein